MRRLFYQVLFLIAPLLPLCIQASSITRCQDVFRLSSVEGMDIGSKYMIQTPNSSAPVLGRLTAIYKQDDGSLHFEFEGAKQTKYTLPLNQIFAAKPATSWYSGFNIPKGHFNLEAFKKAIVFILDTAYLSVSQYHAFTEPYLPRFIKARSDRVQVMSMDPRTKPDLPQQIVANLTRYDSHYEAIGFRVPHITNVILKQSTFLPTSGPSFFQFPLLTLRRGCFKHSINIEPLDRDKGFTTDRFVLYHERNHSILHASYRSDSVINSDLTIQEGLADFMAAHYLKSPYSENIPAEKLRNIEERTNHNVKLKSILDLNGEPHNDGLFVSSLLWKIRQNIGETAMGELLPTITDGINRYQVDNRIFPRTSDNNNIWRIENFVAILKHIAKTSPNSESIEKAIDLYVFELSLDSARLEKMTNTILDSKQTRRLEKPEIQAVAIGMAVSSFGAAIDVLVLHGLRSFF